MNHFYIQAIVAAISSFAVCLLLIPAIIKISNRLNLVDQPNERKVHKQPIPRLGGVGIVMSSVAGIVLSRYGIKAIEWWPVLFSAVLVLFLTGIWDDLKNISAKLRFLLQICCATALAASGIRLSSLFGIFGIHELQTVWQYVISVLIIVGTTNAFNLIDGIDGLAGGLAFISLGVLAIVAWLLQAYPLLVVLVAFAGALAGFLRYNLSPARIFMGDGGSLVIGFLMSSVSILLLKLAGEQPALLHPSRVAILATAVLIIPVFDTIRVFLYRIRKGQSPFSADKTHIHHLFLIAGLDHRKTAFCLYAFELLLIAMAIWLPFGASLSITIVIMVILFHIITGILWINKGVEDWLAILKEMEQHGIN